MKSHHILHDAQLIGVRIQEVQATITLEMVSREGYVAIVCEGVKAFRLVDMQLQNVIYRLAIESGNEVSKNEVMDALSWITSTVDSGSYLAESAIASYVRNVCNGGMTLLTGVPSAGAEIGVLCEVVKVTSSRQ